MPDCLLILSFQGENLDLAINKDEVKAMIGVGICSVKTLTKNHLYCEPPTEQPVPQHRAKREGADSLPEFTVRDGLWPQRNQRNGVGALT